MEINIMIGVALLLIATGVALSGIVRGPGKTTMDYKRELERKMRKEGKHER